MPLPFKVRRRYGLLKELLSFRWLHQKTQPNAPRKTNILDQCPSKNLRCNYPKGAIVPLSGGKGQKKRCVLVSQPFAFEQRTAIWIATKNGF